MKNKLNYSTIITQGILIGKYRYEDAYLYMIKKHFKDNKQVFHYYKIHKNKKYRRITIKKLLQEINFNLFETFHLEKIKEDTYLGTQLKHLIFSDKLLIGDTKLNNIRMM